MPNHALKKTNMENGERAKSRKRRKKERERKGENEFLF